MKRRRDSRAPLLVLVTGALLAACNHSPRSGEPEAGATTAKPAALKSTAHQAVDQWFSAEDAATRSFMLYRTDSNHYEFISWSATHPINPSSGVSVDDSACPGILHPDDSCAVFLGGDGPKVMWVRGTTSGPRIDWKGSYVVNPMTMAAFRARMPTKRAVWRLNAKLSTYFNYEYMGKAATYYSFELSQLGSSLNDAKVYAYAKKGSPEGESLVRELEDGTIHNATLAIAFPETQRSNQIVNLVAYYGADFRQTDREIADDLAN